MNSWSVRAMSRNNKNPAQFLVWNSTMTTPSPHSPSSRQKDKKDCRELLFKYLSIFLWAIRTAQDYFQNVITFLLRLSLVYWRILNWIHTVCKYVHKSKIITETERLVMRQVRNIFGGFEFSFQRSTNPHFWCSFFWLWKYKNFSIKEFQSLEMSTGSEL